MSFFEKIKNADTFASLAQHAYKISLLLGSLTGVVGGYFAWTAPIVEVIGKPLAILVGVGIGLFVATCLITFFIYLKESLFSKRCTASTLQNPTSNKDNSLISFLTERDVEKLSNGHYESETKTFFIKNYQRGPIPLDKNFKKNYEKYVPITLDRIPIGAKFVTISFQLPNPKRRVFAIYEDEYQCSFFIKRGNSRDKVDEKSNRFILHTEHLEKHSLNLMGSNEKVLCFYFCVELGDGPLKWFSTHSILNTKSSDEKVENLTILIESFGF